MRKEPVIIDNRLTPEQEAIIGGPPKTITLTVVDGRPLCPDCSQLMEPGRLKHQVEDFEVSGFACQDCRSFVPWDLTKPLPSIQDTCK